MALFKSGAEGFEPPRWLDQNQLPYHLATPQYSVFTSTILRRKNLLSIFYFNVIPNNIDFNFSNELFLSNASAASVKYSVLSSLTAIF